MPDQRVVLAHASARDGQLLVAYHRLRDGSFRFAGGATARIHDWSSDAIDVEIDGQRSIARITRTAGRILVQAPCGDIDFGVVPRFRLPGGEEAADGFTAQMPGKVIELLVAVGDVVLAGQTVLVLEAMKMEHPMRASEAGIMREVRVARGDQVESGALLLVVEATGGAESEREDRTGSAPGNNAERVPETTGDPSAQGGP